MKPPFVPYIGTFLTILEQYSSSLGDTAKGNEKVINFDRRRKMANTIRMLETFQSALTQDGFPNVESNEDIHRLLMFRLNASPVPPDILLERSFELVPEIRSRGSSDFSRKDCEANAEVLLSELLEMITAEVKGIGEVEQTSVGVAASQLRQEVDGYLRHLSSVPDHLAPKLGPLCDVEDSHEIFSTLSAIATAQHEVVGLARDVNTWEELAVCVTRCANKYFRWSLSCW
eukprot:c20713_g2_i6.p1 GENE.c20713_g2_i6~~c20713_g2_i6.p1  ORF type:complete len:230 (-),score=54.06 c20713_g2_i6:113-802(-)